MAESDTTRFGLRRWTEDTDTPHRTEFDTAHLNIENRAAGFLSGTTLARPVAAAAYDRFYYYDTDLDRLYTCVDTTGAGAYAWVGVALTTGAVFTDGAAGKVDVWNGNGMTFGLIDLYDTTTPGVAGAELGRIRFRGYDSAGVGMPFAQIDASIVDPTDLSEDGRMSLRTFGNGSFWETLQLLGTQALFLPGSTAAPSISFSADVNTGLYSAEAEAVGFVSNGNFVGMFTGGPSGALRMVNGSAALPSFSFNSDPDTGIFTRVANHIFFSTGGVERSVIDDLGNYRGPAGTAAAPALSFLGDADTGFYHAAANVIEVSLGAANLYRFDTSFRPVVDNSRDLGISTARWRTVYAGTGTINTSDEETKTDLGETPLGLAFVRALRPIRFRFLDGTRPHDGFGAQQVREALTAVGVEDSAIYVDPSVEANARTNPYAAAEPTPEFLADYLPDPLDADADEEERAEHAREEAEGRQRAQEEWAEERARFDAETETMRTAPKGLRYSELLAPAVKAIQELASKVEVLESENASLRTTVADLVARVEALEAR